MYFFNVKRWLKCKTDHRQKKSTSSSQEVVMHTFIPNTQKAEAEAAGALSSTTE